MNIDTLPNISIFRPHVHVAGCFLVLFAPECAHISFE